MDLIGRLAVVALAATLSACAAREGVPRPFPGAALPPTRTPEPIATAPAPIITTPPATTDVVSMALGYRGVPYRFGGSDPAGFDCSGFVQYVFKQVGALLPRQVWEQFQAGREIDRDEVQPGDLVFFETISKGASHVGLAIGDGQFIHAPNSTGVVRVESLSSRYWSTRFLGARRIDRVSPVEMD